MMTIDDRRELAERVRQGCLAAAREAYQDARVSGLCEEGAIEAALGAIEMVDVETLLKRSGGSERSNDRGRAPKGPVHMIG